MSPTTTMAQKLKVLLAETSQEDFDRQWAAITAMGMQGPTLEEVYDYLILAQKTMATFEVISPVNQDVPEMTTIAMAA